MSPKPDDHAGASKSERLDVVTATGEFLRTADRSEVHDGGHWHQVFHCLVVRTSSPARVVLQRRHLSKKAFPGLLDLSATGHLTAGETPLQGIRELNEELGISATAADLTPVGVRLLVDDDGEGKNRERVHLFFMADDRPLHTYRPEPTEVHSLVEVGVHDLLTLVSGASADVEGTSLSPIPATEWQPGSDPLAGTISANDLIKPNDGYWTVALVMAKRFIDNDGPLAI